MLCAIRQARPEPGDQVALEPTPTLPEPARLPRLPETVPASLPVDGMPISAAVAPLAIEVRGLPDNVPERAGAAVFADDTGALLCWLPLAAGTATAGQERTVALTTAVLAEPALRITLAPSERAAQSGAWVETRVPGRRTGPASIALQIVLQRVTIHSASIPAGYGQALCLRREEDPGWRPIDASPADFMPDRGGSLELLLGAGTYRLSPWTAGPWQPVTIRVPGPQEVTVTFERPRPVPGGPP